MPEPPTLSRAQLEIAAQEFDAKTNPKGIIPVPIEAMVEQFGIEIYPVPKFRDAGGERTAAVDNDLQSITIDESASLPAYRYALAHECGHVYLHREFLESVAIHDGDAIKTWRDRLSTEQPKTLKDLERQADIFARSDLMPTKLFSAAVADLSKKLPAGLDWFTVPDTAFQAMCENLGAQFETPVGSIERCREDLGIRRS